MLPRRGGMLTCSIVAGARQIRRRVYRRSSRRRTVLGSAIHRAGHFTVNFLAHDQQGTIHSARDLHRRIAAPNLYVKVPATVEGVGAIRRMSPRHGLAQRSKSSRVPWG